MSGEDVVYDVLEHFRIQSTNEMTMAKDYYFIEDNQTSDMEKQAFGRLMYAFDNAEGEGLLDGTGAKIRDYAEGILTAPTNVMLQRCLSPSLVVLVPLLHRVLDKPL